MISGASEVPLTRFARLLDHLTKLLLTKLLSKGFAEEADRRGGNSQLAA